MFDLVLENPASATAYYLFSRNKRNKIFDPYDADDRKLIAAAATGFDSLAPDSPRSKQLKNMTLAAIAAERAAQRKSPKLKRAQPIFWIWNYTICEDGKRSCPILSMLVKSFF